MTVSATSKAAAIKVDLHTHSIASPDGGLREADYRRMLDSGRLDIIAVTDHDTAEFALRLQEKLGNRIIVGEEIRTSHGEIIGLYLQKTIRAGLSPAETIAMIKGQGGLVYIPHPFETIRQGMQASALQAVAADVDIVEIHNGRAAFQNRSRVANDWAAVHDCAGGAGSDSHGRAGWGRTYTVLSEMPAVDTLVGLLKNAEHRSSFPGVPALMSPKLNRLKHSVRRFTDKRRSR